MDPVRQAWLESTAAQASAAGHVFAQMAACEAALESNYGQSGLARQANNLFGMKAHAHPIFGTLSLPTREYLNNQWVTVNAEWVSYPTVEDCFADRMATLVRLQDVYPHYGMALAAPDEMTYIREVSLTWSTDPNRAEKCIAIYREYFLQNKQNNAQQVQQAANNEF